MADNVTWQTTTLATPPDATVVSTEEITTLNGAPVSAQHGQRTILAMRTANATAVDVVPGQASRANSLPLALSTEDAQLIDGIETALATLITQTDALEGLLARPTTGTTTSVNDTAASTTLLAANANRLGATIYNDSTSFLYLKLGATASTSSFAVKMEPGAYYEVPFGYTGIIDGIWSADASGAARIVELT